MIIKCILLKTKRSVQSFVSFTLISTIDHTDKTLSSRLAGLFVKLSPW